MSENVKCSDCNNGIDLVLSACPWCKRDPFIPGTWKRKVPHGEEIPESPVFEHGFPETIESGEIIPVLENNRDMMILQEDLAFVFFHVTLEDGSEYHYARVSGSHLTLACQSPRNPSMFLYGLYRYLPGKKQFALVSVEEKEAE